MVGLVGFIQQAQLSLDRLPPEDLTRLVDFYDRESRYAPQDVLSRLTEINHGAPPGKDHDPAYQKRASGVVSRFVRDAAGVLVLHRAVIRDARLCLAEVALRHFVALLADRTKWVQSTVVDVRLELAYIALLLERSIHPRSARESTHRVYHLNHADGLKHMAIEEIAGVSWLNSDEAQ